MDILSVNIKNCYGINSLEQVFDFTGGKSTYAIYAPNGVMKTSFANVFFDYSAKKQSMDLIYPERIPVREITDCNGKEYPKEAIFVIKPFDQEFRAEKMSTLLVKEDLRKKYDDITRAIETDKTTLGLLAKPQFLDFYQNGRNFPSKKHIKNLDKKNPELML